MFYEKEKLKTASVIILTLTAMALLTVKFYIIPKNVEKTVSQPYNIDYGAALEDVVYPSSVIIYGSENTYKFMRREYNIYENFKDSLLKANFDDKLNVDTSITQDVLKKSTAFAAIFNPAVESRLLAASLGIKDNVFSEKEPILSVFISSKYPNRCYFFSDENTYFIKLKTDIDFKSLTLNFEKNPRKFYSLHDLFNAAADTLITNETEENFPIYATDDILNDKEKDDIARRIFIGKYDFLNRIESADNSYLYSYNYGEETLKILEHGDFKYSNENLPSRTDLGILENFYAALNFLTRIGYDFSGMRLVNTEETELHGKKIFNFTFVLLFGNMDIYSENNFYDVCVSVSGSEILSCSGCRRNVSNILKTERKAKNYLEILDRFYTYMEEKSKISADEFFKNIGSIDTVYYMKEDGILTPCLKMEYTGKPYFCSIYGDIK